MPPLLMCSVLLPLQSNVVGASVWLFLRGALRLPVGAATAMPLFSICFCFLGPAVALLMMLVALVVVLAAAAAAALRPWLICWTPKARTLVGG